MSVSLSGADAIQIDSRLLADLANADAVTLSFENDLAAVKSSKNGNILFAFNETGRQVKCVIRLLAGSNDDKYLNGRLAEMVLDYSKFILLTGYFTKRVGDGTGDVSFVVYACNGGVFSRNVDAKTSSEGDTDQSVAVYTIMFGNGKRSIQ